MMGFLGTVVKYFAFFVLLVATVLPLLVSHIAGGWTRQYVGNPARFSTDSIGDMAGKNVIVTGANTGIGRETVLELARKGARVFAACRNPTKCQAAVDGVKAAVAGDDAAGGVLAADVTPMTLDLGSFQSIDNFAAEFEALGLPLHVLVNNAGVMKSPGESFVGRSLSYGFEKTKEGFEYHIGVNHIAHHKLTGLLMNSLKRADAARVIAVSSMAEMNSFKEGIRFDMWRTKGDDYEDGLAYGQSKLANILFVRELAERMQGTGVTAYSVHPGIIMTDLGRYMIDFMTKERGNSTLAELTGVLQKGFYDLCQFSTAGGALSQLHLATAELDTLVNGGYYVPIGQHTAPSHPKASDKTLQKQLWEKTEQAIASHQSQ